MRRTWVRGALLGASAAASIAFLSGCGVTDQGENVVNGKQQFVANCGACHVLKRAGTTGVTGPNLDEAFQRARKDGFGQSTFAGVVYRQILHPARSPQNDTTTGKELAPMPAKLYTGEDAQDVAAYVASAVAKPGKDAGQLATVGVEKSTKVAKAEGGKLTIPADPSGGLAYEFGSAEAPAGSVAFDSPNESSVDHNIAVDGNGVSKQGPVVKNGAVSKFTVDLKPGDYAFFCSVPGHRQGGMEGKLTVK